LTENPDVVQYMGGQVSFLEIFNAKRIIMKKGSHRLKESVLVTTCK